MKKTVLIFIFGMIIQNGMYAKENINDDIYRDICLFLVYRNIITEEYMLDFKDDYSELIFISEIRQKNALPQKPDFSERFGIYKFGYMEVTNNLNFILIKCDDNFKIFRRSQTDFIINEIIKIRDESPELIDESLFYQYVKGITDYNKPDIILAKEFGSILFMEMLR